MGGCGLLLQSMKIEAYIIAWNESETIHLTIKHYQSFCTSVEIFDNYSDDGTPEIARSMGCEVQSFGIRGVLDDREYTNLKNNCWKGSEADWVILVDADEIFSFPAENIEQRLARLRFEEVTIIKPYGWQVVEHTVPRETWFEVTRGFHYPNYSKLCCFNPKEIREINYVHGCHVANPVGNVKIAETGTLFHYRNVGGPQRLIDRHALYRKRLSGWNIKWKAGDHYNHEDERRIREWNEQYERSVEYSPPGT